MKKITVNRDQFKEILLPFKYNGAMIYAKAMSVVPGLYGFHKDEIFFEAKSELDQEFEIEVPETVDELHEFVQEIDFIVQKISLNGSIYLSGHVEPTKNQILLKPFIDFTKNFEANLYTIEGLKNGYLT